MLFLWDCKWIYLIYVYVWMSQNIIKTYYISTTTLYSSSTYGLQPECAHSWRVSFFRLLFTVLCYCSPHLLCDFLSPCWEFYAPVSIRWISTQPTTQSSISSIRNYSNAGDCYHFLFYRLSLLKRYSNPLRFRLDRGRSLMPSFAALVTHVHNKTSLCGMYLARRWLCESSTQIQLVEIAT